MVNLISGNKILTDDLIRERRICPAIILAVSRIDRVRGRINALKVSTKTINGIRRGGVPKGIKWERNRFVFLKIFTKKILNQSDSARERENIICLEAVKINGNNPRKLLNKINLNKDKMIIELGEFFFKIVKISDKSDLNINENNIVNREWFCQKNEGKIISPSDTDIQLMGRFKILDDGSKIENKFVIILI